MRTLAQKLDDWKDRTSLTLQTADILSSVPDFKDSADLMRECTEAPRQYLNGFWPKSACGRTLCSCCYGRRKRVSKPYIDGLPQVIAACAEQEHQLFHTVMTVLSVPVCKLRAELGQITGAAKRFMRNLEYRLPAAPSFIRKIEVAHSTTGEARPHVHMLIAAPSGTFEQHGLLDLWQKAARLQYVPEVYWDSITPTADRLPDLTKQVRYLLKSPIQVTHKMLEDPGFVIGVARSLHGVRTVASRGRFREFRG